MGGKREEGRKENIRNIDGVVGMEMGEGAVWQRGKRKSVPLDDIDETWLDDFDVASGHVSKCGELHVTAIGSWGRG